MSVTRAGIKPEDLVGEEWAEWYRPTPAERFIESTRPMGYLASARRVV
jgi:hypothetical protein